ncbi:molecular chaperone [Caenimonas terrae]|uniref:Molecular chaperone n=1 Tax=Caenimonas terrae TaxID=696074 RepID=A0ABW0N7C8_9BURK
MTPTMNTVAAFLARHVLVCMMLAASTAGRAGDFLVDPIRLEMSPTSRSGVITVRNEGKEKLSFQMQAMEWTQDAEGRDTYTQTQDLVFFPRLMSVEAGDEGVIRVGARYPSPAREKTYRLFIEELPGAAKPADRKGAQMNVLIRFGAPIFVKPLRTEDRLEIEAVSLARGELSLSAHNLGNQHQVVEGIRLTGFDGQGKEIYAITLADRYLLAGSTKRYSTSVPHEQCVKLARLEIEFKTDKLTRNGKLEVGRAMCS